jgi:hypothetical protein
MVCCTRRLQVETDQVKSPVIDWDRYGWWPFKDLLMVSRGVKWCIGLGSYR